MAVLKAHNISIDAWGVKLISSLSLKVAAGEILAIIGPNGAGKSTLLNILAGNLCQQKITGNIVCCGQPLAEWEPKSKAKHMAILPQLSELNFPFTVAEVVNLARIPHNTGVRLDAQIIEQALCALDIYGLKQRLYTQLSGGERQRVQLARVMAQVWRGEDAPQRLLLLDEPTSSLDLGHQQQLMQALRKFADQGVGIVMVLHDVNLAAQYADRLLALSGSEVVAQGIPTDVVTPVLMQQLYGINMTVLSHSQTKKPVVVFAN